MDEIHLLMTTLKKAEKHPALRQGGMCQVAILTKICEKNVLLSFSGLKCQNIRRTYGGVSQTKLFTHRGAEDEGRELSSATFISVMSDGCTDSAVMEEEVECRVGQVDLAGFRGFPQRDSVDITVTVMPYDQLCDYLLNIIKDSNIT